MSTSSRYGMFGAKMPVIHVLEQKSCGRHPRQSRDDTELENVEWQASDLDPEHLPRSGFPGNCFLFMSSSIYLESKRLREEISTHFRIPRWFWSVSYQRSNGSFGCETVHGVDGGIQCEQTWFRFLVKQLKTTTSIGKPAYVWYEMGFFTHYTVSNKSTFLCFDMPDIFRDRLQESLNGRSETYSPYDLHTFVINEVVTLYDNSVWTIRDFVRDVESNRSRNRQIEPEFPALHDLARHAIHSSETLQVAIETMSSIMRHHDWLYADALSLTPSEKAIIQRNRQSFHFQLQTLKSLKTRSDSNQSRLQNEITLAFNMVTQRDSQATVRISEALRSDSRAMKTVAVLTLAFLPATFVSAIFSTQFFNFTPGVQSGHDSWVVSDQFWIYWAFSAPLTVAAIVCWFVWDRWFAS